MDSTTPLTRRLYYRCHDCLTTLCVELDNRQRAICGICGGPMDFLGVVQPDNKSYARSAEQCLCNDQCQTASGPNCDCHCGGKNHGIGYRTVVVVVDRGTVKLSPAADQPAALARANQYRAELENARARIAAELGADWKAYTAGGYVQSTARWNQCRTCAEALREAKKGKMHKSRIAKLRAILPAPAPAPILPMAHLSTAPAPTSAGTSDMTAAQPALFAF
jgi:hypothetical protein